MVFDSASSSDGFAAARTSFVVVPCLVPAAERCSSTLSLSGVWTSVFPFLISTCRVEFARQFLAASLAGVLAPCG